MSKFTSLLIAILLLSISNVQAQFDTSKFGKGLNILGKDSTYKMRIGVRFQNLMTNTWTESDGNYEDLSTNILVRRARLKFDGYAFSPKLKYKMELGLTNRDIGSGNTSDFKNAPNVVLDAFLDWNFYKNFTLRFGQSKLAGNRERVISSANLQMVDRSLLNSRYNIDRDMGFHLKHHFNISNSFLIREVVSMTQGEGRNVTSGSHDGMDYTFRVEMLPFGAFKSKGDYTGADLKREPDPKLAVGLTYDINQNAVRERGQLGSFIRDDAGIDYGKDLNTFFVDLMFKYQGFSVMAEYAQKATSDEDPIVMDDMNNSIGTFFTGKGMNVQTGYLFKDNWEISLRYTNIMPDKVVSNEETQYTLGLSKYVVGHKLKVQTDVSYTEKEGSDSKLMWRLQTDIHF